MYINHLSSFPDGEKQIEGLVEKIIIKDCDCIFPPCSDNRPMFWERQQKGAVKK